ncbi:unnamed protein product [Linum trigynum]|uniref:Retrotransposon gag domain-containing protein n=1 Tax=Linum trigynum TaxID=586398 RepID=A0AAV2DUD2_9ROSI
MDTTDSQLHVEIGQGSTPNPEQTLPSQRVEDLQAEIERLRAQIRSATEAPQPLPVPLPTFYGSTGVPRSSNNHYNGIPATTEAAAQDVPPIVPHVKELPPPGTFSQPSTGRPLALAILNEPYPGNIHIPNLPEYNGTTDPEDHLSSFEILMPLIGASDATMCKIFPATLGGDARRWYSQLRNGIINNFTEFSTLFRCKFYAQKRQAVSINQLMNTKQREGEALKAYYARYNTLAIGVTSLSVEVIVNTLTRGTTNSLLRASLIKKPPRSMFELQERVMKYIDLEEALQDSSYVVPKRRRDSPPPNRLWFACSIYT